MKENLAIFDHDFVAMGTASREEVHKKGLWHQTFHCWIIIEEYGQSYLVFQKRHEQKDTFANLLDISAAGHLLAGEGPEDGVRELEEELGIAVPFSELTSIGVIREELVGADFIDKEFCHVFLYKTSKKLTDFAIQEEELTGLVKINVEDLLLLVDNKYNHIDATGFTSINGNKTSVSFKVSKSDLVPHYESYYLRVCRAVKNYSSIVKS
ncbi:NUDIX hydrolase [Aquibacillus kalidii]|uniref:NUDIX hydrolase n=1 Tax=Aquibacillus kalidii TaxID=2762597 RepID=UPI001F45B984|nr:NUDIX domain-containing protein [Aquibacillus kalidii]